MKNPQTFNRYTYVLNSPYKFTDPLGLLPKKSKDCTKSCVVNGERINGAELIEDYRRKQQAEHPPAQRQDDPDWVRGLKGAFLELSGNDRNATLTAIQDTKDSVDGTYSTILTGQFRNNSGSVTPQQAVAELEIGSVEIIRDKVTGEALDAEIKGNVFDGRTSTYFVKSEQMTVEEFFNKNPQTRAITIRNNDGSSFIFLGKGFFDQDREGKAKSMIHEWVVHRGFGRDDTEFDPQRKGRIHEGSLEINRRIDLYFRLREPTVITN